ncbi:MAG: phosphatase PAP2 family protein [Planctomycetes bacterium]|nr:phosphatase PAP2 family protein [Planctomycetota bacterium]
MTASRPIRQDYFFDSERKGRARSRLTFFTFAILGLILTHLLDNTLFRAAYVGPDQIGIVESKAWYQILRQAGDIRTWLIVALAVFAHAFWRAFGGNAPRIRIGGIISIALAPIFSGILAEILRAILGRERPLSETGEFHGHLWRNAFAGIYHDGNWFDSSNLGFPSSHAAVAMAGAIAVARAFPGSGFVLVPVAVGCAFTRMLAGRHFASDVFLGMLVGWAVGALVSAAFRRLR